MRTLRMIIIMLTILFVKNWKFQTDTEGIPVSAHQTVLCQLKRPLGRTGTDILQRHTVRGRTVRICSHVLVAQTELHPEL